MSDTPIEKMDFKQLRNEVQLLRDELAVFKRKYEDIIYNLDNDNFSSRIVKEKDDMKAELKVTAEEISTKVSNGEFESYKSQTAEEISTKVSNGEFESYKSQTAEEISSKVSTDTFTSEMSQMADHISAKVTELNKSISNVSVKADEIETSVTNLEDFNSSTFTQTSNGFTLDGERTTFTGVVYLTNRDKNKTRAFSIFFDGSQGHEQVILHNCDGETSRPLVLGDLLDTSGYNHTVYIGSPNNGNEVVTKGWVEKNFQPRV